MKKRLVTPLPIPWYKKEDAIPAPVSGIDKNANCKNNAIPETKWIVSGVYANIEAIGVAIALQ